MAKKLDRIFRASPPLYYLLTSMPVDARNESLSRIETRQDGTLQTTDAQTLLV